MLSTPIFMDIFIHKAHVCISYAKAYVLRLFLQGWNEKKVLWSFKVFNSVQKMSFRTPKCPSKCQNNSPNALALNILPNIWTYPKGEQRPAKLAKLRVHITWNFKKPQQLLRTTEHYKKKQLQCSYVCSVFSKKQTKSHDNILRCTWFFAIRNYPAQPGK